MGNTVEHIPLLQMQRDLYAMPRGYERFREYLRTMQGSLEDDIEFAPLVAMNPMGREHLAERLEELLAMGAEEITAQAIEEALPDLPSPLQPMKHGLVITDDVRGGWTNRYSYEAGACYLGASDRILRNRMQTWITTCLWVSETPTPESLRAQALCNLYRTLYVQQQGKPQTLREILQQEGAARRFAKMQAHLEEEDIAYSRAVLEPLLESTDFTTCFVALLGDGAAEQLGYPKLGLSERAGFAVALTYH
jgi:hypothetical protein